MFKMLISYTGRDPYMVPFFTGQFFFIVLAPVLFCASIYSILTVLIKRIGNGYMQEGGRTYSPLPPRLILYIFITSDIVATLVQGGGAAMVGIRESKGEDATIPNNIVTGGLAFQVVTFSVFIVLSSIFVWRARHVLLQGEHDNAFELKGEPTNAESGTHLPGRVSVSKRFLIAFTVSILGLYLRTCYRLAESAKAQFGTKAKQVHEIEFAVLEFAPVVISVILFNFWHPGRCLQPRDGLNRSRRFSRFG
jgi:uncharacterized membrane protein (DUF485 family)